MKAYKVRPAWLSEKMILDESVPVCPAWPPKGEFLWESAGLSRLVLENELIVEVYGFVRLNFQKEICIESAQELPT